MNVTTTNGVTGRDAIFGVSRLRSPQRKSLKEMFNELRFGGLKFEMQYAASLRFSSRKRVVSEASVPVFD